MRVIASKFAKMPVARLTGRRGFSSTSPARVHHWAAEDGPYSNIPFKVHGRKIPYALIHFGFFGVGLAAPFLIVYIQMKRSGQL